MAIRTVPKMGDSLLRYVNEMGRRLRSCRVNHGGTGKSRNRFRFHSRRITSHGFAVPSYTGTGERTTPIKVTTVVLGTSSYNCYILTGKIYKLSVHKLIF